MNVFITNSDDETSKGSANSSRRNSDGDSDSSVRSLESIEKVLQRRNRNRGIFAAQGLDTDDEETSDSDSDENTKKRKRHLRNGGNKRARAVGKDEVNELIHFPKANFVHHPIRAFLHRLQRRQLK